MIKCNICNNQLNKIFSSNSVLAVSSDNKSIKSPLNIYKCPKCFHIQKISDNKIKTVYETYKNNDLVNGQDQIKFVNGKPFFRTDILIKTIINKLKNKKTLLDIGTGTGVFLSSCNNYFNFDMSAFDLNSRYKNKILSIKNVTNFYTNSLEELNRKFDIISMIHVLEHIEKPLETLKILQKKLNKNGIIIIQVPSINENLNDALIYDHYSNFTKNSLFLLLSKVFTNIKFIKTEIKNEITVVIENNSTKEYYENYDFKLDFSYINTLNTYLNNINHDIYIFGTAPTSTYYASILKDNNNFKGFLDEDILKKDKFHLDKKIYHPKEFTNIDCFIPLSLDICDYLRKKYKDINFITTKDIEKDLTWEKK